MVGQFMATAPPRVQTAVKSTVMGLLGSLRSSPAFESNVVTTKTALAKLMFQLEMTGYMFRCDHARSIHRVTWCYSVNHQTVSMMTPTAKVSRVASSS